MKLLSRFANFLLQPFRSAKIDEADTEEFDAGTAGWEERALEPVKSLAISGPWQVTVASDAAANRCRIQMPEKLFPALQFELTAGRLSIGLRGRCRLASPLRLELSLAALPEKLKLSGAVSLTAERAAGEYLNGKVTGASSLTLTDSRVRNFKLQLSGASKAVIDRAERAEIAVSGASELTIRAAAELTGDVSGGSRLRYSGVDQAKVRVSGSSRAKRR